MVPPPCLLTTGWRRGHHAPIDFDRQGATSAGPPADAHPYCTSVQAVILVQVVQVGKLLENRRPRHETEPT